MQDGDDARSLEQIEGDVWGDPPADATTLVARVHHLRRQPVGSLDAEDLRLLLTQHEGLDVLVPRALRLLEQDPLTEGDYYPGDLLVAVTRVPATYWARRRAALTRLERVVASIPAADIDTDLTTDLEHFRAMAARLNTAGA